MEDNFTGITAAQTGATESIAERRPSPSPPDSDSDGGIPVDLDQINYAAVYQNSLVGPQGFGPAVDLSSLDILANSNISPVNVPRLGIIRTPTGLDLNVEDNEEEEFDVFPKPGRISSQNDWTKHYTIANTTPDLRLELRDGKLEQQDGREPVIEKVFEEPDNELIDANIRSSNFEFDGSINTEINRAPIKGHGLPEDDKLKQRPNGAYQPSEKSNITDLGARGLQIASKRGRQKLAPCSEDELQRPIQDRLLEALHSVPGHREQKGFFPEEQLETLIDERSVAKELESCFKGTLDSRTIKKSVQKICGLDGHMDQEKSIVFKKIFVTLVLSEKTSAILLFLEENVTDKDLPLSKVPIRKKASNIFGLARKSQPGVPLACFRDWTNLAIMRFEEWQWTTLAPFFFQSQRKNVKHWILQDEIPLPFTADSRYNEDESAYERLEFEGGFSNVFKADIHPEHHDFHAPHNSSQSFAIKCLLSKDRKEFKREADTLMKFSGDAHQHLVSLLATYEQFKKFYLIFYWAEADLLDYWSKKNPNPSVDYDNVLWIAIQCSGITDGLSKIHIYEGTDPKSHQSKRHDATLDPKSANHLELPTSKRSTKQLYGRHGDIKPQNILWFRDANDENDKGILKITDFGLTEFSANHSKSYKLSGNIATSPSYRPPEIDLEDGIVGRSYDIWTLGCLYLELITWLLGGWDLVEKFHKDRMAFDPMWFENHTDTFFEIVRCEVTDHTVGAMVKPKVTRFIFDLHCHPSCTEYIHEFLNVIQMDILIIKSPNPKDKGRISCVELNRTLLALLEKCKNDCNYASKPAPWDRNQKNQIEEEAVETNVAKVAADILQRKNLRVHSGKTQPRVTLETAAEG
ncbi:hypothetical protein EG329_005198 [Mollisiaceae sp. DMI_Dod_QoI]|nr:hypothetical protein EG329_005198 [Helotiales sp. DMI_Dod_QoI]